MHKRAGAVLMAPMVAADTRTLIERAALRLFVRDGFDAATTRSIAAEAGISEGAIYRHFKSKDELAGALFLAIHRRLTDVIENAAANAKGIDAQVDAAVRAYCAVADDDWLLYSFHLLGLHRFLPLWEETGRDPVSAVERIIAQAIKAKEIPRGDPAVLAAMALGIVSQTAQNIAYGRIKPPLGAHAGAFVTAIRAVFRAR
ncbi:MAG: TetR family transcriptional regulator [Alphaproteobacteria bacterium]|nr:MAG: TetR family transcriptional regulator [Caulobacteraceae bacterium]TPW04649.1 MAG: TetR family transcriptional regulator [Alphaproteobacteria bacterium]